MNKFKTLFAILLVFLISFGSTTSVLANQTNQGFRVALSLGQGVEDNFSQGITYTNGSQIATNSVELQQMYLNAGATEMYVRIATKRYNDGDTSVDPYHAQIHNLEVSLETCRLAAQLNLPINPEIMCAYTYMDGFTQQAPDFKDYPEIEKPDKPWSEYTLDEMCGVLEQYGELVAREILATGCRVDYWNIGNEANFGFGGVNIGLKTAVNADLENKTFYDMYYLPHIGADYLKENVWNYNAQMMAAVAKGIKKVDSDAKFSTHVACQNDIYFNTTYYNTLKDNGFSLDQAGISIYPTNEAGSYYPDYMDGMKSVIKAIIRDCGLPVFIAEYSYPSGQMDAPLENWDVPVAGYELNAVDQARYTADFIAWCKKNGVSGIRPWGPDVLGYWEPMSLFSYDSATKLATAKPVIDVFSGKLVGTPSITRSDKILTADLSHVSGTTDDYYIQWYRNGIPILLANDTTYQLKLWDYGSTVTVRAISKCDSVFHGFVESTGLAISIR